MRCLRRPGVLFLALIALGASNAWASDPTWWEVRSSHFHVITDAGEKRASEVAVRCEQMRAAFLTLMQKATADDPAPLVIVALRNQQELDELALRGNLRHAGIFLPGIEQSFIVLDISNAPWRTLYHEYAHELLHANTSAWVQTWFEEGFAEYFSTLRSSSKDTDIGEVPAAELDFLRKNGKLFRLSDLVRVNQTSDIYNHNGPLQAAFYAQSWLLVHYLFDHGLINRTQSFFTAMAAGVPLDEALPDSFGIQVEKLEQELVAYARGEKFRYFSLPPSNGFSPEPSVKNMTPTSVSALELEIRWHTRIEHSKDDALTFADEYKSLLRRDPENAIALRGLGLAYLELSDYESSFDALRRAVERDPNEAVNHHAMAMLLNAMDLAGLHDAHPGFSVEDEAQACTSLAPHFADAHRLQASGLAARGEFSQAIAMMRQAVTLSPRTESYELTLADLELREHDYVPAMALLHQLQNSHDPEVVRKAEYFLSSQVREAGSGN
jgi:tetratricopeptide (TPR) repeat protein